MFHKINQYMRTSCLALSFVTLASPALAEGNAPCTNLAERVKKLEDFKAVRSDGAKIAISGWVNRAIQWADNGFHSNTSYVSPGNVTSNLQINGMYDPIPDWTVGAMIQIDFNQNGTAASIAKNQLVDIHRAQSNDQSEASLSVRQAEVVVDSKKLGKVSLGRGYMASSGVIYYTDLSGTYFFLHPYSSIGGISFRNKATGGVFNPNPLNGGQTSLKPGILVFEPGDGGGVYGRNDRIRYDTPNFYGLNFSTSHSYQNFGDLFDFALKFAAPLGSTIVTAQVSWARNHTRDVVNGMNLKTSGLSLAQIAAILGGGNADLSQLKGPKFDTWTYAAGVLFPLSLSKKEMTGLNFHFSGATRKWKIPGQRDGQAFQGKIGYLDYFIPIGKTAFVISGGQWKAMDVEFNNLAVLGGGDYTMIGKSWGAGVVQSFDPFGASIYARYDNYRLTSKGSGNSYKPVNIVYAGALVKL